MPTKKFDIRDNIDRFNRKQEIPKYNRKSHEPCRSEPHADQVETCDKNYRPIRVGDVLKVFHFTGARRKKHYMYKQVVRTQWLGGYGGRPKVLYFFVSHLSLKPESVEGDGGYWLGMYEGVLEDYEIVQCPTCDFEDREKVNVCAMAEEDG